MRRDHERREWPPYTADNVNFSYNTLGQQVWTQDQSGNVIETFYDVAGRATDRLASTIDADFDDYVDRITTAYTGRGQVEAVVSLSPSRPPPSSSPPPAPAPSPTARLQTPATCRC